MFLREARLGRVKSRLARSVGGVAAVRWYRNCSSTVLHSVANDPRWQTILAVSPDHAGMLSRTWPDSLPRIPQGPGSLGDRMVRVFEQLPPGPVIVIGSDIPGITPAAIDRAFRVLGRHDAIFGASPDGGYWLVGLKRIGTVPARFLSPVRWSSEHALEDSVASISGLRIGFADSLADVDSIADLRDVSSGTGQQSCQLECLTG